MKPRYAKGTRMIDSSGRPCVVGAAQMIGEIVVYEMIDEKSGRPFQATEGALDSQYKLAGVA